MAMVVSNKFRFIILACMLMCFSSFVYAIPVVEIHVKPVFHEGDSLKFDYILNADQGGMYQYYVGVACPGSPQPVLELKQKTLRSGEQLKEEYISGVVTGDYVASNCSATFDLIMPAKVSVKRSFSISVPYKILFDLLICDDSACSKESKVFTKGQKIYFSKHAMPEDVTIDAIMIAPDSSRIKILTPGEYVVDEIGMYIIQLNVSKENFNTVHVSDQFAVIDSVPVVKDDSVCVADGVCSEAETFQTCPQDCIAVVVAEQGERIEEGISRIYYVMLGILFLVFVFGITFFEYERFKHRKEQELDVKNYVMSMLSKGYAQANIKAELLKSGWNADLLNNVFKSLSEYDLKIVKENDSMYRELQLKKYVFGLLNNGVPEAKIRIDLKKSGWSDAVINKVFEELKIYFGKK